MPLPSSLVLDMATTTSNRAATSAKGTATEIQAMRAAHQVAVAKRHRNAFTPSELQQIESYIKNPIKVGYWRLSFKRRYDGKFFSHLANVTGLTLADFDGRPTSPTDISSRRSPEDEKITNLKKLTTFLSALTGAMLLKKNGGLTKTSQVEHGLAVEDSLDSVAILAELCQMS